MKYYKVLALFLITVTIVSLSCEPDDICPESAATTPNLIITLYDISNKENSKNAFKFKSQGVGKDNPLTDYNVVTTDSIVLPLKTNDVSTQYSFHKDYTYSDNGTPNDTSDDIIGGNEDIITVNYTTEQVYVSRACGYKTVFKNVTVTVADDGNKWIQLIEPQTDNQSVEDETAAHFKLFH